MCCHLDRQETIADSVVRATNWLVSQIELICAYFYLNMQGLNREANYAYLYICLLEEDSCCSNGDVVSEYSI